MELGTVRAEFQAARLEFETAHAELENCSSLVWNCLHGIEKRGLGVQDRLRAVRNCRFGVYKSDSPYGGWCLKSSLVGPSLLGSRVLMGIRQRGTREVGDFQVYFKLFTFEITNSLISNAPW